MLSYWYNQLKWLSRISIYTFWTPIAFPPILHTSSNSPYDASFCVWPSQTNSFSVVYNLQALPYSGYSTQVALSSTFYGPKHQKEAILLWFGLLLVLWPSQLVPSSKTYPFPTNLPFMILNFILLKCLGDKTYQHEQRKSQLSEIVIQAKLNKIILQRSCICKSKGKHLL